ncbi:DUF4241 domain-containing protein [Treponema sp. OMZ 855]|uniref:DUF4241 domain-containing protein n=1 Tax=Treponema sp. OMZ 855 TaxID=1643512 RepID=UPI0020A3985F|nr:DUF4241 domain-containing protein [Treponema sp. OMZ 855]UTC51679.1 DUF4241 domain-containing protein [Treponema sp. OMZ 855]
MIPTKEWIEKYEKVKELLVSPVHYGNLFSQNEVQGKKLFILPMGTVHFPTGNVLVRDPLVYLNRNAEPYLQKVPTGIFPLETLVVEIEEDHYRYVATRVKFSNEKAAVYREALIGNEDLDNVDGESFFGFNVDAGLATVVDVKTRDAYCNFESRWANENPDKNIYDDYFAKEFKKSYVANPRFQRDGGDWINYPLEGTDLTVPMIQSGFGDGKYPVYFGYDKNDAICELVIEYIFAG